MILKFMWKCKGPRIADIIMKKTEGEKLEDFHDRIAGFIIKLQ